MCFSRGLKGIENRSSIQINWPVKDPKHLFWPEIISTFFVLQQSSCLKYRGPPRLSCLNYALRATRIKLPNILLISNSKLNTFTFNFDIQR